MHFNNTINQVKLFKGNSHGTNGSRSTAEVEEIFDSLKKFFKSRVKVVRSKKLEAAENEIDKKPRNSSAKNLHENTIFESRVSYP